MTWIWRATFGWRDSFLFGWIWHLMANEWLLSKKLTLMAKILLRNWILDNVIFKDNVYLWVAKVNQKKLLTRTWIKWKLILHFWHIINKHNEEHCLVCITENKITKLNHSKHNFLFSVLLKFIVNFARPWKFS